MQKTTILRALYSLLIFVMGSLQAWDSSEPSAGLMIVLLVSLAIALPAVAMLLPLHQAQYIGIMITSLILLLIARLLSPVRLPDLFVFLVPAAIGLFWINMMLRQSNKIE
jgi:hypothetical protein